MHEVISVAFNPAWCKWKGRMLKYIDGFFQKLYIIENELISETENNYYKGVGSIILKKITILNDLKWNILNVIAFYLKIKRVFAAEIYQGQIWVWNPNIQRHYVVTTVSNEIDFHVTSKALPCK